MEVAAVPDATSRPRRWGPRQPRRRPRLRPSRRILLWTAALSVTAVVLGLLWNGSDYANTSLRTAAAEPSRPAKTAPTDQVGQAWTTDTGPAADGAVADYTVVVGTAHGVRGLDPGSGEERWHYLRSTALLCDWTTSDGVVVALFRTDAGCDEALALDAGTGTREWYRNVSFASRITLRSTNQLTMAMTPTGIAVLGTTSNGLRWRYHPPEGCRIADALPGDVGVAVLLDCPEADGSMVLLDGFTGKQRWTAGRTGQSGRILTADGVVGVLATDLTGALQVFDREGVRLVALTDPGAGLGAAAAPVGQLFGQLLAVYTGSTLLAVDTVAGGIAWTALAQSQPALLGSDLLVFDGSDFVQHDLDTGAELRRIAISGLAPAAAGALDLLGPAIVVSTPTRVTVYR